MSLFKIDIQDLKTVGVKSATLFRKLGIKSPGDLLCYYPSDYESWDIISDISSAALSKEKKVIKVKIVQELNFIPTKSIKKIYKVRGISDDQEIEILFFNNKGLATSMKIGEVFLLRGEVKLSKNKFEIISPKVKNINIFCDKLLPLYPQINGLPSWKISKAVKEAINILPKYVKETLPKFLVDEFNLASFDFAIRKIHFPLNDEELKMAKRRINFEELITWRLSMYVIKNQILFSDKLIKNYINNDDSNNNLETIKIIDYSDEFIDKLPFKLTLAQKRAIDDCKKDMENNLLPMRRLLQGDVGSGKTVVAMAIAYSALKNGYQAAIMVPTEILAIQHFKNFTKIFSKFLINENGEIFKNIYLITGSTSKKERKIISDELETGKPSIVIGTHCLFSNDLKFKKLVLTITDEQHRFGVNQRLKLISKGISPHMLVMSATPIPRSLALCLYGDLDFSIIDELPPGRKIINTVVTTAEKRDEILKFVASIIKNGFLGYIICAAVGGETEELEINLKDKALKKEKFIKDMGIITVESYKEKFLNKEIFKEFRTEIIYGKMKENEKEKIMSEFYSGEIKLLISTTVIEVGVDVPKACVMVIENAEKFGLAQLHQLRGRVGRGSYESYCFLISDIKWGPSYERLKVMKYSNDGFYLANQDLKQRGPGDFFGKKQHGKISEHLILALKDNEIINDCVKATEIVIKESPDFSAPELKFLKSKIFKLLNSI